MDVEKLIDRLKNYSIKDKALLNLQTVKDAAEALEKLQAENESLKNKLHDSYQGHLLDVVIPRLEAELEKAKMARPIELTGKGAEAFALAAELSETKQELEKVKAERDAAVEKLTLAVNQYRMETTEISLCGLCECALPPEEVFLLALAAGRKRTEC